VATGYHTFPKPAKAALIAAAALSSRFRKRCAEPPKVQRSTLDIFKALVAMLTQGTWSTAAAARVQGIIDAMTPDERRAALFVADAARYFIPGRRRARRPALKRAA
jgi:hypothetical protein